MCDPVSSVSSSSGLFPGSSVAGAFAHLFLSLDERRWTTREGEQMLQQQRLLLSVPLTHTRKSRLQETLVRRSSLDSISCFSSSFFSAAHPVSLSLQVKRRTRERDPKNAGETPLLLLLPLSFFLSWTTTTSTRVSSSPLISTTS